MELVLEILNTEQSAPSQANRKVFDQDGGSIGRKEQSGWVLIDPLRHVSGRHAAISCDDDGHFYLKDCSTNGTRLKAGGARLEKNVKQRIEHDSIYLIGHFEVRARIVGDSIAPAVAVAPAAPAPPGNAMIIPDGVDFGLAPVVSPDRPPAVNMPVIEVQQCADYAPIEREHLLTPTLMPAPSESPEPAPEPGPPAHQGDEFWQRFAQALGIDLDNLDQPDREALAINAARLFRLSVSSVQQSLRTRSELKNELRLALTTGQYAHKNPLKHAVSTREAMNGLLLDSTSSLSAEQAITQAFKDLQAHQVALLGASRAALRSTLEHFAPEHLSLRFERDGYKPMFATAGNQWRAYERYHQALQQDDDWSERLLARDFVRAYEEQVRLIDSLHTDYQG